MQSNVLLPPAPSTKIERRKNTKINKFPSSSSNVFGDSFDAVMQIEIVTYRVSWTGNSCEWGCETGNAWTKKRQSSSQIVASNSVRASESLAISCNDEDDDVNVRCTFACVFENEFVVLCDLCPFGTSSRNRQQGRNWYKFPHYSTDKKPKDTNTG